MDNRVNTVGSEDTDRECLHSGGRDPPDNLEEVDVDDFVEEVDGGIGDRADRSNAGEGELNRIPLSFSSVCGGEG